MAEFIEIKIPDGMTPLLTQRAEAEGYQSVSELLTAHALSIAGLPPLSDEDIEQYEDEILRRKEARAEPVIIDAAWKERKKEQIGQWYEEQHPD